MNFWENLIVGGAIAIISAGLTAAVGLYFGFKQFRRERWWDKKVEYYIDIVHSLFEIKLGSDFIMKRFENCERAPSKDDQRDKRIVDNCLAAAIRIERALSIGCILLPRKAMGVLEQTANMIHAAAERMDIDKERQMPADVMRAYRDAANWCIESMIPVLKKELKVT